MIYLQLFWTFFKIGALTFGGGYAMIPLVQDAVVTNEWLTEEAFLNFIAVAESTPGPIAINMATYIGSVQGSEYYGLFGGLLGSIVATMGVVLPSFVIILMIVALIKNFVKYAPVQAVLKGIRPVALALILSTGITLTLKTLFGFSSIGSVIKVEWNGIIIFAAMALIYLGYYFKKKKFISPIILIIISACMGMALYSM